MVVSFLVSMTSLKTQSMLPRQVNHEPLASWSDASGTGRNCSRHLEAGTEAARKRVSDLSVACRYVTVAKTSGYNRYEVFVDITCSSLRECTWNDIARRYVTVAKTSSYNRYEVFVDITCSIKATGTCLWIKLICHKLARITAPTNKLSNYFKNQSLKKSLRYSCVPHRLC